MEFGKISDIGHMSFVIFGNIGAEWGRGGELWAHTSSGRSYMGLDGF